MRQYRRLITLGILVTTVASVVVLTRVSADDSTMTDAQVARIQANCISAKNSLNQLSVSDALLRVNRGQLYDSMTSKLMTPFNSRADSNNFDAKDLETITSSYNAAFTAFSTDYQAYAEQLSNAIGIDCQKEPVSFYDAVADARTLRAQVHTDVVTLDQYIDSYSLAFETFVTNNQQKIGVSK